MSGPEGPTTSSTRFLDEVQKQRRQIQAQDDRRQAQQAVIERLVTQLAHMEARLPR